MVVSMLAFRLLLDGSGSLKDKRKDVLSVKDKLQRRYKVSIAEIDGNDNISTAIFGVALVSNSKNHGETVMSKIIAFLETTCGYSIADVEIFSQIYG